MSTFALKITALILMVIDHIGCYFDWAPHWFRIIGRGSYPLFLFCMVWGYKYTKDRRLYLLRLYIMSVFMSFFMYTIDTHFVTANGYGNNNIFVPMLLVGVIISTIETFQRDRHKGSLLLAGIFLVQVLYAVLPMFIPFLRSLSGDVLTGLIPNLELNEYGSLFVILGVIMYFTKENKDLFTDIYIIFCMIQFAGEIASYGVVSQAFMIIALPFMLKYNNEKGPGLKYFFYIFYPAHTFILFYLANFGL